MNFVHKLKIVYLIMFLYNMSKLTHSVTKHLHTKTC